MEVIGLLTLPGSTVFVQQEISGWWLVVAGMLLLLLFFVVLIVAVVIFLLIRRRGKRRAIGPAGAAPALGSQGSSKASYSPPPLPSPSHAADVSANAPSSSSAAKEVTPAVAIGDQGKTVDLSATIAIQPDTSPINYGSIKFTSGTLAGKQFEVTSEGACIGRDSTLSQIIITDPRISKRHMWIGVRDGRVTIVDHDSRNGTFVNDTKSPRVTETTLNSGDIVILGESDVARFEYTK